MLITSETFTVKKRFPLTISRGTSSQNTNIWLKIKDDDLEGWGEITPFSITQEGYQQTVRLQQELTAIIPRLSQFHPLERQAIAEVLKSLKVSSAIRAGFEMALYDWLGKRANLPLWQLWGLNLQQIKPTSVTVGINTPENALQRIEHWQQIFPLEILKVKLGSPEGIEADQAILLAISQAFPHLRITVDANGGWCLRDALTMCEWLAIRGVEYIEQPLAVGQEKDLPELYERSPLPIFIDESCFNSQDIIKLAHCVHGINIKIMKAGGIDECQQMISVARSCGLKIMFGCYSDSSLANTAMCQLAPLADYLDLDSHLNLLDDPFQGASLENGRLLPNDLPGLGVKNIIII